MNNDIIEKLFCETSSIFTTGETDYHNHIINECIIAEAVGNDKNAFNTIINECGRFAARDNLLEESCQIDCCVDDIEKCQPSEYAAILACAKENGDPDYDIFIKAQMLAKHQMCKLKEKYNDCANDRVNGCKDDLFSNDRVSNTIVNTVSKMPTLAEKCF